MTTELPVVTEIVPMVVQLQPAIAMTDAQFFEFCQLNRDLRIERTAKGEVVIMPPTGLETDGKNFDLIVQLGVWAKQDGTGKGFGSSGGFTLPNGAVRSPTLLGLSAPGGKQYRQRNAENLPQFVQIL